MIKHVDKRFVERDDQTSNMVYSTDYSNTYYHPVVAHIQRKNPIFTGLVCMPLQLCESLNEGQKT